MPVAETNARLTITLAKDTIEVIDEICKATHLTRSEFISVATNELIAKCQEALQKAKENSKAVKA